MPCSLIFNRLKTGDSGHWFKISPQFFLNPKPTVPRVIKEGCSLWRPMVTGRYFSSSSSSSSSKGLERRACASRGQDSYATLYQFLYWFWEKKKTTVLQSIKYQAGILHLAGGDFATKFSDKGSNSRSLCVLFLHGGDTGSLCAALGSKGGGSPCGIRFPSLYIFNNYSSSPNGLWINSPWGRRPKNKTALARKTRFSRHCLGFQSRRFSLLEGCNI